MLRGLRFSSGLTVAFLLALVASAPVIASNTYFFPQTAAGTAGDLTMLTQFSAYNPTQRDAHISMSFRDDDGMPLVLHISCPESEDLTGDSSTIQFILKAGTKYAIRLSLNGAAQAGWTMALSDVPLQISATYGLYRPLQTGGTQGVPYVALWEAAVLPAASTHELSFPVHLVTDELVAGVDTNTGYAVANLSNWGNAHVTAQLYNANGSLKGEETFSVDVLGHRAEFLSELFKDLVFNDFRGILKFSSNSPIAVVALKESKNGEAVVYSSMPVEGDSSLRTNRVYDLENNGDAASAQVVYAPSEIHGAMNAQGGGPEPDYFAIDLTQGQTLQVLALANLTGSPLNPILSVRNPDNQEVAHGEPIMAGSSDVAASYTAPAAGRYFFRVTSTGGAGRGHTYRLFVRVY